MAFGESRANGAAAIDPPIVMDVRLMAADLVDEMVYSWSQSSPLAERAKLVLADVAAPVGLDDRFNILVENRLYELLKHNPQINVDVAHCGPCTRLIAKSTPSGTIIARGIDQPEVLAQLQSGSPGRQALSLDFEAAGRDLVLRAQIYTLTAEQKILWAQTYSTSMSAKRALRDAAPLISLAEAQEQQRQILARRDPLEIVTRLTLRNFNVNDSAGVTAAPLPVIEQSFEAVPLPRRHLRAAVTVGFSSIDASMGAWSVGGHLGTLLLRSSPSWTQPDLYATFGAHYVRLRGPGALPFAGEQVNFSTLNADLSEPRAAIVTYRLALEAHVKHRLGMLTFVEAIPTLGPSSKKVIVERSLLGIPYRDWGIGMVIRW